MKNVESIKYDLVEYISLIIKKIVVFVKNVEKKIFDVNDASLYHLSHYSSPAHL